MGAVSPPLSEADCAELDPRSSNVKLGRREFLSAGASVTLLAGFSRAPLFAQSLGADPFTLGVASGDPWPDGFVIWTRLAPRPLEEHGGMPAVRVPVRWEVAEDEGFTRVVRHGETVAIPELAHSVHVELEGLRPHRHYWYRFAVAGSDVSPIGKARTAPAAGALLDRLRIGVGGCQHYEMGYFDAWGHLAKEPDLDLIFHYGDYIYEYAAMPLGPRPGGKTTTVRQHVGGEIYSIDDYRRRYAQYKSDPHLRAAHAACAFAVSFDDHEIDNNWVGDFDQDGTNPEIFALRRAAGLQAWYEHMPVRKSQFPTPGGITAFRRLDFGRLMRMHVLDTRSYRADQPCDDGKRQPCRKEDLIAATTLGKAQESWLDARLNNGAKWNLLAQQIMMMPFDFRNPGATEPRFATDIWDAYRPARSRLKDSIEKHGLTNVIIATGDHHKHLIGTIPADDEEPEGKCVAVEFLTGSISSDGNGRGEEDIRHYRPNNPHVALHTDRRGYQIFEVSPKTWTTEVKVIDQVEKPAGAVSTLAKFVVTPEAAALQEA